jgi:hypothetical protein
MIYLDTPQPPEGALKTGPLPGLISKSAATGCRFSPPTLYRQRLRALSFARTLGKAEHLCSRCGKLLRVLSFARTQKTKER